MKTVRCAIYTRKSSDEGLEQGFNSLDAQREACAAYILSQASEGWAALPDIYDDGGISGGTLERPALQRLLAEVRDGRIDIIVVYKVDRLTRSLLDFSKLVEAFDKAGTSFVSITQSFNTTTSMGRLTLNMLLSFAQFEREVTAERIRDKIAASKAKGMWMGGTPPLGYEPDGRSLKIVPEHAAFVHDVIQRYLELGNVRRVEQSLARDKIFAPARRTSTGRSIGSRPLTRGQIYAMLKCQLYIGIIPHNGHKHKALHQPIIDLGTWDSVQARLADNVQGHRAATNASSSSLLAGKVIDAEGEPLIAAHANKGRVRYRYYVSRALQDGQGREGWRIPARELEGVVVEHLATAFDEPTDILDRAQLQVSAHDYATIHTNCADLAAQLRARRRTVVDALVNAVRVEPDQIVITVTRVAIAQQLGVVAPPDETPISLAFSMRLRRSGRAMRFIQSSGAPAAPLADPALLRLLAKARGWWLELRDGQIDVTALAQREGTQSSYIARVLRLAFLSPVIVDAMLRGEQRAGMTATGLREARDLPGGWRAQELALLGPPQQRRVFS